AVTTSNAGTYYVTATDNGCTGDTANTVVVVNQTPAAPNASASSPVCEGDTIYLSSSASGVSYNWSGPNSFASNMQNPQILNASSANAGDYNLSVTSNSCVSDTTVVTVTVTPTPATPQASSNSPLCGGDTLHLMASNIAGVTYNW